MDWKENEVREDLHKVIAMMDALSLKYGEDFSCVLTVGCDIGAAWAGESMVTGKPAVLHPACHALLESAKFVDELCDTIKCVLYHNTPKDVPEVLVEAMERSMDSLKKVLLMSTKAYKKYMEEKEIDDSVDTLIQSVFGHEN